VESTGRLTLRGLLLWPGEGEVGSAETLASSCKTTERHISEGSKFYVESRQTVSVV